MATNTNTQSLSLDTCSVTADKHSTGSLTRGMCQRHYTSWYRTGNPIPVKDMTPIERINRVGFTTNPETGCMEYKGYRNPKGYGQMHLSRLGLHNALVHRVVFEAVHGPIPAGLIVRHTCDNPACASIGHLLLGTHADNMADMVERGRHFRHGQTHCDLGHEYTPENYYEYVDGGRCRTCRSERQRRYREKGIHAAATDQQIAA